MLVAVVVLGTITRTIAAGEHPRRYEIFGMLLGAALGLLLERRPPPYEPPEAFGRARALNGLIGTAGIALLLLLDRTQSEDARLLGTLTAGLATLWAVVLAPRLFQRLGLHGAATADPAPREAASTRSGEEA